MQELSAEVLTKASQGDLAAFEQIYKTSAGFVYNVALRVVNNREEAQEISQEVFLTVYHKLKTFRLESSLKTWIYRITVNCAINHFRKMTKEHKRTVAYDENSAPAGAYADPAAEMSKAHQEDLVASLLRRLNPDQKICVILRSIEGLSYQEIADVLKTNINTVRSRLKRARETLLHLRKEESENEM